MRSVELHAIVRSRLCMAEGNLAEARRCLERALALEPNLPYVHAALAALRWPGPSFRQVLAWLHELLVPGVYLEVGVEQGLSMALARPPTQVVGVDPNPIGDPTSRCAAPVQLFVMPSQEFLREPPSGCALNHRGFDLAFVDGDHRFEAVLDDFIGLERWAAPGAVIVLHDTLPLDATTASPVRRCGFYTGDGWKLIPCLRILRPDLRMVTLPVAPTGLTLITSLDPAARALSERRQDILECYGPLDAARAVDRTEVVMAPLGVNDRDWIGDWLAAGGVRRR